MKLLNRVEWGQLTDLDPEAINSLRRRDQLPTVPGPTMGDRYTPLSALLMEIANEFANKQGISRTVAAQHASRGFMIDQRWADVAATSNDLYQGGNVAEEIFFAVIELPGKKPRAVCDTLTEIVAANPNPTRITLCNVTRAAFEMRKRAARHKIDLGDFWGSTK